MQPGIFALSSLAVERRRELEATDYDTKALGKAVIYRKPSETTESLSLASKTKPDLSAAAKSRLPTRGLRFLCRSTQFDSLTLDSGIGTD
jgi:hypothetical protein